MSGLLADVWQREIDGVARRWIRDSWVHGMHREAAVEALKAGASVEAVRAALGECERLDEKVADK